MLFLSNKNEIVWDKDNDKALCKFQNGKYEAKNSREIELLKKMGYKSDKSDKKVTREEKE